MIPLLYSSYQCIIVEEITGARLISAHLTTAVTHYQWNRVISVILSTHIQEVLVADTEVYFTSVFKTNRHGTISCIKCVIAGIKK